jgi:hypothetical protein
LVDDSLPRVAWLSLPVPERAINNEKLNNVKSWNLKSEPQVDRLHRWHVMHNLNFTGHKTRRLTRKRASRSCLLCTSFSYDSPRAFISTSLRATRSL